MVLGISQDFTSTVNLDNELTSLPSSGLYLNSGVHPSVKVENILEFLPKTVFTFENYDNEKNYEVFSISRNAKDIVKNHSNIYQCLKAGVGNDVLDTEYWLETNIESLRIKAFIQSVKDRVFADLSLTKRLINNQYIYESSNTTEVDLTNDYAGWVLEPKGSDYVSIRVNEISLQKEGTTPVNLYVLNQNTLVDTITITPNNGELNFKPVDLVFGGKGTFKLVIDSTNVYRGVSTINPFKFNGFLAYTTNGIGNTPETANYTYNTYGNGIGLNVSAYLDATQYIENNLSGFGNYIRSVFEVMVFEMYLHNSNNRSNRVQRIQMDDQMLIAELKDMKSETIIKKYHREKKRALEEIQRTFDTQLKPKKGLNISINSY